MEQSENVIEKTTLDWFLADVSNAEIEVTSDLKEALVSHARDFLMACGRLSWERWAMLGRASRAAFVQAAIELKIRNALEQK